MGQASASVRELRSKLSHYLRLTKAGESVVITERGVPIGCIVPMGPKLDPSPGAVRIAGAREDSDAARIGEP